MAKNTPSKDQTLPIQISALIKDILRQKFEQPQGAIVLVTDQNEQLKGYSVQPLDEIIVTLHVNGFSERVQNL